MKKCHKTTEGLIVSNNQILAYRLNKLFSNEHQIQVAKKIGVSQPYIGNFVQGVRHPKFKTIQKISEVYDVTIDWLFGIVDNKNEVAEIDERIHYLVFVYCKGLKNTTVSQDLGMGRDWLNSHIRGERSNLRSENAKMLADYFDVSVEWLTNGKVKDEVLQTGNREFGLKSSDIDDKVFKQKSVLKEALKSVLKEMIEDGEL